MKIIKSIFSGIILILVTLVVFILKIPFLILFPTRVVGKKNLKGIKTGAVIAINHFSNFDIVYILVKLFYNLFSLSYLGKKELSKNKLFGVFLSCLGTIFISRGEADLKAMREVNSALKNKKRVLMFPEGTRNKTGSDEMQTIKSGVVFFAKKAQVPIIPIKIEHRARLFRLNKIYIGEPHMVGQNKTQEEVEILTQKFNNLSPSRF